MHVLVAKNIHTCVNYDVSIHRMDDMLFPMVHDKGGLGGSICMYSVISKTTVLFLREERALGIFGLSVAP